MPSKRRYWVALERVVNGRKEENTQNVWNGLVKGCEQESTNNVNYVALGELCQTAVRSGCLASFLLDGSLMTLLHF